MPKVPRFDYEWDFESTDIHGDVVDHDFIGDDLTTIPFMTNDLGCPNSDGERPYLVLVIYEIEVIELTGDVRVWDKSWAYTKLVNGKWVLPKESCYGHKVPQRFHDQLAKWQEGFVTSPDHYGFLAEVA
jgi:hypothetical protein